MTHRIIPRAEWGARHPDGCAPAQLPASELWLHHSAGIAPDLVPPFTDDYAAVRTLESIGQSRFGCGISYSFVATPAGLIFQGHSVNRQGTHTGGRNNIARAICLTGNYDNIRPSTQQIAAIRWLIAYGHSQGWWTVTRLSGGHQQAPLAQTACPGRYGMAAIPLINSTAPLEDTMTPEQQKDLQSRIGTADMNNSARTAAILAAIAADPANPLTQEMVDAAVSSNVDAIAAAVVALLPAGQTNDPAALKQAVKDALREGVAV